MIKMIAGVFGLPIKNKAGTVIRVEGKGPNDGPFSISPEREAELVKMGVAQYVEEDKITPATEPVDDGTPIGFDEMPPLPEGIPEYSEAMKATELREIGAMCGLTFKVGMTKKEMVAALDAFFDGHLDVEPVDDGEPAPSFDAAEAVQ